MFAEDDEMLFDMNDFLFSTEAHLLPLHMKPYSLNRNADYLFQPSSTFRIVDRAAAANEPSLIVELAQSNSLRHKLCPSLPIIFATSSPKYGNNVSGQISDLRLSITQSYEQRCKMQQLYQQQQQSAQQKHQQTQQQIASKIKNFESMINNKDHMKTMPLRAGDFVVGRKEHLDTLKSMGVTVSVMGDGKSKKLAFTVTTFLTPLCSKNHPVGCQFMLRLVNEKFQFINISDFLKS